MDGPDFDGDLVDFDEAVARGTMYRPFEARAREAACNLLKIKTLKNREYAARGIPFAYSETDGDFHKIPYILKVPADERPIDIHRLIRFYIELDLSPRKIRDSIKNLSWKEQMMKVIKDVYKRQA